MAEISLDDFDYDDTKSKDENAEALIAIAIGTTAVAGFFDPTPGGIDVPVIIGAWATMLAGMANIYGMDFDRNNFTRVASAGLGSAGMFTLGTKALTWILKMTGFGWIAGGGINAFLNGIFTWRVGRAYQKAFKNKGDLTPEEFFDLLTASITFVDVTSVWKYIKNLF